MKVATCTICRLENNYLIEFVEYYKSIGVDHMFIYDNNIPGTENVIDILQSYVDDGFVTVIDWQDQELYPMGKGLIDAFTDCWNSYKDEYDWIAFLDNDEFLTLVKDKTIHEYLSRECFNNVDAIRINWLCYDDNDLIYYEDKPLRERFTHPCGDDPYLFDENKHIKSIINTKTTKEVSFELGHAAHAPIIKNAYLVNNCGEKIDKKYSAYEFSLKPINYDLAYYAHYRMKTIDEYIHNKIVKLTYQGYYKLVFSLDLFFKYNKYTKEKYEYYDKHILNSLNTNVVYTVIIDEYDNLNDPTYVTEGWDYICFTNNKNLKSDIWRIIYIDDYIREFNMSYPENRYYWFINRDQYINRYLKIKIPVIIYYTYNFSIYIDGNITICGDLNEFKKKYIDIENKDNVYLWALKHASRNCIYDEIEACRKQHKDSDYNLDRLLNDLNKRNFPHNLGLSQNSILCRYHNGNYKESIEKHWFRKILNYTVRDQCTLFWVLYQLDILDKIKLLFDRNNKEYFRTTNKHN